MVKLFQRNTMIILLLKMQSSTFLNKNFSGFFKRIYELIKLFFCSLSFFIYLIYLQLILPSFFVAFNFLFWICKTLNCIYLLLRFSHINWFSIFAYWFINSNNNIITDDKEGLIWERWLNFWNHLREKVIFLS